MEDSSKLEVSGMMETQQQQQPVINTARKKVGYHVANDSNATTVAMTTSLSTLGEGDYPIELHPVTSTSSIINDKENPMSSSLSSSAIRGSASRMNMVKFAIDENDVITTTNSKKMAIHNNGVPIIASSNDSHDSSGDGGQTASSTMSSTAGGGTTVETNTGVSSTNSKKYTKLASRELRGNLTRKLTDRNPYESYEVIKILGLGSMGSVAMVKKRQSAIGGSARKPRKNDISPTTSTTNNSIHPQQQPRQLTPSNTTTPCFEVPMIGSIIRWLHHTFHVNETISYSDDFTGTARTASDYNNGNTMGLYEMNQHDTNSTDTDRNNHDMTFAMKSIHVSRCTDPIFVEELLNEIAILKTLDHPHIEKVIETFDYENQLFVILELCYGGDLYQRDPYTEDEAARITSSILSALTYMHSKNILHRDLKYENILFVDDSPTAAIKLIDFGLSKQFYSMDKECSDGVGTIYTMAPEVLKGKYTQQADLWSVGVITYMLLSSQMPFYGRKRSEIVERIMEGEYEYKGRRWKKISKAGKAFIDDLLVVDPEDRATGDEALRSSWLNRRYRATVRNPKVEEIKNVKESVLRFANYSKIRQMALMVIAHKSTSAEIGILRKIFQQYDTNNSGHLNYEQFKAAIADTKLTEEDYRRIFDAVDLDGSDKIRYTEFLAAAIEANGAISEVKLAEAFDRLDSDDSGFISVENLLEILGENNFTREDVEEMIQEVTVTDGQISYSEFLSLWENTQEDPDSETKGADDTTDETSTNNAAFNSRNGNQKPHDMIKTVQVVKKSNPFDSERSCGAMSALSTEMDDPKQQQEDHDPSVSRNLFLQGKMMSERNMLVLDQERKRNDTATKVSFQ